MNRRPSFLCQFPAHPFCGPPAEQGCRSIGNTADIDGVQPLDLPGKPVHLFHPLICHLPGYTGFLCRDPVRIVHVAVDPDDLSSSWREPQRRDPRIGMGIPEIRVDAGIGHNRSGRISFFRVRFNAVQSFAYEPVGQENGRDLVLPRQVQCCPGPGACLACVARRDDQAGELPVPGMQGKMKV